MGGSPVLFQDGTAQAPVLPRFARLMPSSMAVGEVVASGTVLI